jgi:2'-5' RNA ligase
MVMAKYFIEARIMGQMKYEIRYLTLLVRKKFHLKGSKPVPHITIVCDCSPKNPNKDEKKLISTFKRVCANYENLEFRFNGFGCFHNTGVAKINIAHAEQMCRLRDDLIKNLRGFCCLDPKYDGDDWSPHATIALKLHPKMLDEVMGYLKILNPDKKQYYISRATLLENGKILREYDFFLKRSLSRFQALNPLMLAKTQRKIREELASKN